MERKFKCRCGNVFDNLIQFSHQTTNYDGRIDSSYESPVTPCCASEDFTTVVRCALCEEYKPFNEMSTDNVCSTCAIAAEKQGIPVYQFWKEFIPHYVEGLTEEDFKDIYYRFNEYECMDLALEDDWREFCDWLVSKKEGKK